MKRFAKLLGLMALVTVIGFSMVSCGGDGDGDGSGNGGNGGNGGSGTLNWNGVYTEVNGDKKTTVSFTNGAGTITGYYEYRGYYEDSVWNGSGVISNVTLGDVTNEKDEYWTKDWAYLYIGTDKIGVIYRSVHKNFGGGYNISIGYNSTWMGGGTPDFSLSDVADIVYRVDAEK